MTTLADLQCAILAEGSGWVGPITLHVVNFIASNPFPRKFVYRGCSVRGKRGICKTSVEATSVKRCGHNSLANGTYLEYYCFQLVLMDPSLQSVYGVPTMRVSIWDAARALLGMSAASFASLDEIAQFQYVQNTLKEAPYCNVSFRVVGGVVSIQELAGYC
ncbi:unnamed protein product [Calypogeia fissa]